MTIYCDKCKSEDIEIEDLSKEFKTPRISMSQFVDENFNYGEKVRKAARKIHMKYRLTCKKCGHTVKTGGA